MYPADEPDVRDLGLRVYLMWDQDGQGFSWHHPACRGWSGLRFMPDPDSTGHVLIAGGHHDTASLTIQGSLVCPMGCGAHGFIRGGRWIPC